MPELDCGSHSDECTENRLVGCDAVESDGSLQTFRKKILHYTLTQAIYSRGKADEVSG